MSTMPHLTPEQIEAGMRRLAYLVTAPSEEEMQRRLDQLDAQAEMRRRISCGICAHHPHREPCECGCSGKRRGVYVDDGSHAMPTGVSL